MEYNIQELASAVGCKTITACREFTIISELAFDSRSIGKAAHTLFVCIVTTRNDGHQYIDDLIAIGVKNFIVSNIDATKNRMANFIIATNTIDTLQAIAAFHRQRFIIPVIGITGSNGKTIVKEWLYQLLHRDFNIIRSPRSFNSQIGVPLSVWQIDEHHNLAIIEAGISQPYEMQKLAVVIKPTIGILTHMGEAHSQNFESSEQQINEKLQLFDTCTHLIYNNTNKEVDRLVNAWQQQHKHVALFCATTGVKGLLHDIIITSADGTTNIAATHKDKKKNIRIFFTDEASIENAIYCWCVMLHLGLGDDVISQRMAMLHSIEMRLQMLQGLNNCMLVNDSYNSDLGSLRIALDFMQQVNKPLTRTVILSDILQSGKDAAILYREIADLMKVKKVQRLIGIGGEMIKHQAIFEMNKKFYHNTENFLKAEHSGNFSNELILIKGARTFEFEKICRMLQEKSHATILEINLDALVYNFNFYKAKLSPGIKTMCMVKAFAYGGGSFEIASTLQFHRADYLAVAYTDEGVALRKEGITLPLMVMNPEANAFDTLVEFDLQPEIYSMRILRSFIDAVSAEEIKTYSIHIKLDTGMHRLGFEEAEIEDLCSILKQYPKIKVETVFSHLAASGELLHRQFTHLQLKRFSAMCSQMEAALGYTFIKHIANSSAVVQYPEAHFDMVRLGIGLHGIGNTAEENSGLQMVSRLKTTITQIKKVKAGETVGYSRKGIMAHDSRIATIAIGYADGLSRKAGNGAYSVMVNGRQAPIVGNVCMDMIMADVTNIECNEGDDVTIFDTRGSIMKLATVMQTIVYEVLTGISERVKRVYVHE